MGYGKGRFPSAKGSMELCRRSHLASACAKAFSVDWKGKKVQIASGGGKGGRGGGALTNQCR